MLDTDTKRRIDTARDILVGKVPDPKSQVEQITIALIYKFMDDMDAEAEELGGRRKFFAGDFARYGWAKLMRSGLGGHETLNLYAEAIAKMPENPGIPPLFREIFKNAYLPYRDPETLRAFLKIIDEFEYDHSERLGDAFEYLLSVLGSQGDAGQFRTPRHVIDFIVDVLDPKKNETVLDPACGTAGFLISSWKHILKANTDADGNSTLTPDERGRLAQNFKGYDISPDMVRLSLVNLYLHGFTDPHIFEYDTLTSQERWNDYADVILANPPFMSPKGGIKPHKRFSVQSKRSEVLFVDYMAEHLTPQGRAGIIVPEGIIFQSQTAYIQLRKMLVENFLVAVVSLPAGVFNPYSGVKTSILILDRSLARRAHHIAFFKVANDGFGLGAQRRAIDQNDLPRVAVALKEWFNIDGQDEEDKKDSSCTSSSSMLNSLIAEGLGLIVSKEKIAANGDYNLSGERYRDGAATLSEFPHVTLNEVCEINPETASPAELYPNAHFNYIDISCVENKSGKFLGPNKTATDEAPSRARRSVKQGDVLMSTVRPNLKAFALLTDVPERAVASTGFAVLRAKPDRLLPGFLIIVLRDDRSVDQMVGMAGKGAYPSINQTDVESLQIPLPPLEVQKEIVAEIECYQKVIDGARAVLDNYRPHIQIRPDWPFVELRTVARLINGRAYKQDELLSEGPTPVLRVGNFFSNRNWYYSDLELEADKYCNAGDLLYAWSASFGPRIWEGPRAIYHYHIWKIETTEAIEKRFLFHLLAADSETIKSEGNGIAMMHATKGGMEVRKFPLPALAVQQAIVAEIEAEQALVDANRELITRFEKKIQATLARLWGEDEPAPTEA
ncbi:N-6 DNA methylase [uncultured Thiodictyon sp.]|uniref:N-6 DNA methylase n=1 Tax=uncultured Thiodictyon sp. TaxID=1846217 RepID=UPI0025E5DBD1|nr:N-6 DNA methylase [uncultured Thiodictyon sp.]